MKLRSLFFIPALLFASPALAQNETAQEPNALELSIPLSAEPGDAVRAQITWTDFDIAPAPELPGQPLQLFEQEGEQTADWEATKNQLRAAGVATELHIQPATASRGLFTWFKRKMSRGGTPSVPPSRVERYRKRMGLVIFNYRLFTSSVVWMNSSDLHPAQVAGLILVPSLFGYLHMRHSSWFDRWLARRFSDPNLRLSAASEISRRLIYSAIWAEWIKLMSSGANGTPEFATPAGQLSVLTSLFTVALGDAVFSNLRGQRFGDDSLLSAQASTFAFYMLAPFQVLQLSGLIGGYVDLAFFQVDASTALLASVYIGLIAAIRTVPDRLPELAQFPERWARRARRFVYKVRTALFPPCKKALTEASP